MKDSFPNRRNLVLAIAAIAVVSTILFVYINVPAQQQPTAESKVATKVIDGDTIVAGGESVRLLGIDADERGYPCYDAAKKRLEELVLNKEVQLEMDAEDKDRYGRYLRYVFADGENVNLLLVKEGLAIARFYPENEKYKGTIIEAEKEARENSVGCKWE